MKSHFLALLLLSASLESCALTTTTSTSSSFSLRASDNGDDEAEAQNALAENPPKDSLGSTTPIESEDTSTVDLPFVAFTSNNEEEKAVIEIPHDLNQVPVVSPYSQKNAVKDIKNARFLVNSGGWGVIATLRGDKKQTTRPFTSVVDYVDDESGVPHFLLTTMDETARDLSADSVASFTISGKTAKGNLACMVLDAQDPPCSRITFLGKVAPLPTSPKSTPEDVETAKRLMERFKHKYPQIRTWPSGHNFKLYKFVKIEEIFYLDHFGGARPMKVADYQKFKMDGGMEE
jgi:hypothetical protein